MLIKSYIFGGYVESISSSRQTS